MADDRPTLLTIATANGADAVAGLIDEAAKTHPEITMGFARTIAGVNYRTLVRTAVPTGGSFRSGNQGVAAVRGTYENRLVECYIFNKRWECDKAVADAYEDGAEAFIALEADAIMEAGMQDLAKQFYYGIHATFGNPAGFPGLLQAHDTAAHVVDAGGTTDSVNSSAWLVKFGPKDTGWVLGRDGQIAMDPVREESVLDSGGTNKFTAYVQELLMRPGLQVGSLNSVVRIKKLNTDAGKGLTDKLVQDALALFPAGIRPDVILVSRRSRTQLQQSRTAVNQTGAPAPMPTEVEGVPLVATDAISNVETLAL